MISFCQFGAGRIGAIHAENIARHPGARLGAIVDVDPAAAKRLASRHGSEVGTQASVLADRSIQAVVIASSTNTLAVANSSTGSSPDSQHAISRSWIIMSRNRPPERRTNSIGGGAGS